MRDKQNKETYKWVEGWVVRGLCGLLELEIQMKLEAKAPSNLVLEVSKLNIGSKQY